MGETLNEKKYRNHKWLDKPILGYFLLIIFGEIVVSIIGSLDGLLLGFIPGYSHQTSMEVLGQEVVTDSTAGFFYAVGAVVCLLIYKLWFQGQYEGSLVKRNLLTGLILISPLLILHVTGSIVSLCQFGATEYVLAAFLRALCPGFSEEVIFRGLGVTNYMRNIRSEKQIITILLLSGLVFGFFHMGNALAGADPALSILQSVYAAGVGFFLGAVFLRTGSLWPTIICHTLVDFAELARNDLYSSGGLLTSFCLGDWITIAVGIAAGFFAFYLVRKEKRAEIMEIWAEKWHR